MASFQQALARQAPIPPTVVQAMAVNTAGIYRFDYDPYWLGALEAVGQVAAVQACILVRYNTFPGESLFVLINGSDTDAATSTNWHFVLPGQTQAWPQPVDLCDLFKTHIHHVSIRSSGASDFAMGTDFGLWGVRPGMSGVSTTPRAAP